MSFKNEIDEELWAKKLGKRNKKRNKERKNESKKASNQVEKAQQRKEKEAKETNQSELTMMQRASKAQRVTRKEIRKVTRNHQRARKDLSQRLLKRAKKPPSEQLQVNLSLKLPNEKNLRKTLLKRRKQAQKQKDQKVLQRNN